MSQRQWNLLYTVIFENVCELLQCTPWFSTIKHWYILLMHRIINLPGSLWRAICPWIQIKYVPWLLKNILLDSMTELSLTGLPNELWQWLTALGPGAILPKGKREKSVLSSLILCRTNASLFLFWISVELEGFCTLFYWNLTGSGSHISWVLFEVA